MFEIYEYDIAQRYFHRGRGEVQISTYQILLTTAHSLFIIQFFPRSENYEAPNSTFDRVSIGSK